MKDYKYYQNLNSREIELLTQKLFTEIKDEEEIVNILVHLSLFTDGFLLKKVYPKLVENKRFYPSEIYLHADDDIVNRLIELLSSGEYDDNSLSVNHILCCLAWIGTQKVADFFNEATNEKPEWSKKLHVPPSFYTEQGGWTILADGTIKQLTNKNVKVLENKHQAKEEYSEIPTFVKLQEKCPFCNNPIVTVFENEINGAVIPFSTCILCGCYEPIFMRINDEGKSLWHNANKEWPHHNGSYDIEPIEENILALSKEKREPTNTISQFVETSHSQIGGYPTWIQDSEYLNCPDCNEKMDFIGQVDMEDVEEYGEGIYYFHYCSNCHITGSNYQQT